jgi:hypothetical protein
VDGANLSEVADQNLRRRIEIAGDQIKIAVIFEIEQHARTASCRRHHCDPARLVFAHRTHQVSRIGRQLRAVELKPRRIRCAAWFHAEHEFGSEKLLALVIEQQRIDSVAERKIHRGGDEDVVKSVGIDVADTRTPRPIVLDAHGVRHLVELTAAKVAVERVAKDKGVDGPHEKALSRMLGFRGFQFGPDVFNHVRVHVGDKKVQAAVVVVIEELDSHRAPGGPGEIRFSFFNERPASLVFKIVVGAHHVEEVDIGPAVLVEVGDGGIAAPSLGPQVHRGRDISEAVAAQVLIQQRTF